MPRRQSPMCALLYHVFLADEGSCRFSLDELFVFAAPGEGFDVELVFFFFCILP